MKLVCKICHYEYDFELYGSACPKCHTENQPFRSIGAQRSMGLEPKTRQSRYFSAERQEKMARASDPMYGKSAVRRLRPFLMTLAICFAVAALGSGLLRLNHQMQQQEQIRQQIAGSLPPGETKPPISELSSANFNGHFQPVSGYWTTVGYTGQVSGKMLLRARSGYKWIFIDLFVLTDEKQRQADALYIYPYITYEQGGKTYTILQGGRNGEIDLRYFTPLEAEDAKIHDEIEGQLFYEVPEDVNEFTLHLTDSVNNTEQRMRLHL